MDVKSEILQVKQYQGSTAMLQALGHISALC